MSYQEIDAIIRDWADKYKLTLYTSYQDQEVRSVDVADPRGQKYQIWIDPPDRKGNVEVHAWDYSRKRKDYAVSINDLRRCLEDAYAVVLHWSRIN